VSQILVTMLNEYHPALVEPSNGDPETDNLIDRTARRPQ
jgi:hypothetical protein